MRSEYDNRIRPYFRDKKLFSLQKLTKKDKYKEYFGCQFIDPINAIARTEYLDLNSDIKAEITLTNLETGQNCKKL